MRSGVGMRRAGLWCGVLWLAGGMAAAGAQSGARGAGRAGRGHGVSQPARLAALSERERVEQLLSRFTFGAQPGQIDQVLAEGEDAWLDQQLRPSSIADGSLEHRLQELPTLAMTPAQALAVFPDRAQLNPVADGKQAYPGDPLLRCVYEVQVAKILAEREQKKADGSAVPVPEKTEAEVAAAKAAAKATAARVAGELLALPKSQRMAALEAMPVADRIAFTTNGNLSGDERNLLLNDASPREREALEAMAAQGNTAYNIVNELAQGRVLRDVLSQRQLQAVMTAFWFNHFNIFAPKDSDQWYTTSYERDVIRAHALGRFEDLLLATAESPAMMVYLDNWLSIGPDSLANGVNPANPRSKRGNRGLNENYGREVMELHTLSVNGGYSQADVTALSAILTGWGVDKPQEAGPFAFDSRRHEPGPKFWMGYEIAEDGTVSRRAVPAGAATFGPSTVAATPESLQQGLAALKILAAAPQTAHFISYLLAQEFVADQPPAALVSRLQGVFLSSKGDIATVLRALIASPEFNSREYFHNKVKTPEEFLASAYRATAMEPQNPQAVVGTLNDMGMPLFRALPPTGYYLTAEQWMNSTALVDRLNFAYRLTSGGVGGQRFDSGRLLAMGVLAGDSAAQGGGGGESSADAGMTGAMRVLERTMMGEPASERTNELMLAQMHELAKGAQAPKDASGTLNVLTALVLGSPEFQQR